MVETKRHSVIIVGAGPAGLATALHLAQRAPELAADLLIIEAKEHPRRKLCGGAVTFHGEEQLRSLGLQVDIPAFVAHKLVFRLGNHAFTTLCNNAMRIFERAEFDAALARAVSARGLSLHSNERLLDLSRAADGYTLTTDRGRYHTRVIVAADGANSTVRRKLRVFSTVGVARLLRIVTPIEPGHNPTWQQHTAVFDFSCIQQGIQGYVWDFPCYIGGQAYMNHGIFDSRIAPDERQQQHSLKQAFAEGLEARHVDLDAVRLEGHPVRWFHPAAEFARPHVLFAGDAAGVDPLFAEGISYAMEYGAVATDAIIDAFARKDFSFETYRGRLLRHKLGRSLKWRALVARHLYRHRMPQLWALLWQMAMISPEVARHTVGSALDVLPPVLSRK